MYSHQKVVELQFTRMSWIGMITQLQYKKEKYFAVVLILAAVSIVSPTRFGDPFIDCDGREVYLVVETVG